MALAKKATIKKSPVIKNTGSILNFTYGGEPITTEDGFFIKEGTNISLVKFSEHEKSVKMLNVHYLNDSGYQPSDREEFITSKHVYFSRSNKLEDVFSGINKVTPIFFNAYLKYTKDFRKYSKKMHVEGNHLKSIFDGKYSVQFQEIPSCCGGNIIHGLPYNGFEGYKKNSTHKDVAKFKSIVKELIEYNNLSKIYLLQDDQSEAIEFFKRELGFEEVLTFQNDNTGEFIVELTQLDEFEENDDY